MKETYSFPNVFVIVVFLVSASSGCKDKNGTYDLTQLKGVWTVIDPLLPESRYEISLCEPFRYTTPDKVGCNNSSVCLYNNGTAESLGDFREPLTVLGIPNPMGNYLLSVFATSKPCKTKKRASSSIQFRCGKHLGSPVLMHYDECVAYFHWETYVACESPKKHEVPCYVHDDKGRKIDLTPLISERGGYNVISYRPGTEIKINVCSNLQEGYLAGNCSSNTGICVTRGNTTYSFGSINSSLEYTTNGIVLNYGRTENCRSASKIVFRCPKRQQTRPPTSTLLTYCSAEIEWYTEYACPEDVLKADINSCKFTEETHGVSIDLSPLQSQSAPYTVHGNIEGHAVEFYLNVCAPLSDNVCDVAYSKHVSACMMDENKKTTPIGMRPNAELKFADSSLALIYQAPKACENNMTGATIIYFICGRKNDSLPLHLWSDNCVHEFLWETKHACVQEKFDTEPSCILENNGELIDLSLLEVQTRLAFDEVSLAVHDEHIVIAPCGEKNPLCDNGADICKLGKKGEKSISLGSQVSAPVYNAITESVVVTYTNGNACKKNHTWSSTVSYKCGPRYPPGLAFLTNVDEELCHYEFEWHSVNVCPVGSVQGSNCQIMDTASGVYVDLSSLKSNEYSLNVGQYNFTFSICGTLKDSPCAKNSSVCRTLELKEKEKPADPVALGEAASAIYYKNEVAVLYYKSENRSATIMFMCKSDAGIGKPEFFASDPTFENIVIHWYTNLVCPQKKAIECIFNDVDRNRMYDLSGLSRYDSNWEVSFYDGDGQRKAYINICRALVPQKNCNKNTSACVVNSVNNTEKASIGNAGVAISHPEITTDGQLQLVYTHGDACTMYGTPTSYSTIIYFVCPDDSRKSEGLYFLGKSGSCKFMYIWTTSSACPISKVTVKNECYLTDPITNFVFDLNPLRNDSNPYSVTSGDKTYKLNICGPVNSCNSSASEKVSVCEVSGKERKTLGHLDSYSLTLEEHVVSLVYSDKEKTKQDLSKDVVVTFPCSESSNVPTLKFMGEKSFGYLFEMRTSATCISKPAVCEFEDRHGDSYDLTSLAMNGFNWIASDTRPGYENLRYHVNFCRPLNRLSTYKCPGGATAVCQISTNGSTADGIGLGLQHQTPIVSDDNSITLLYENGAVCNDSSGKTDLKSSTSVKLLCSSDTGALTFVGVTPECQYIFTLSTPAACPLKIRHGTDCTVMESNYGYKFDLKPLGNRDMLVNQSNTTYSISVCGALKEPSSNCKGAAVCEGTGSTSKILGMPNSNLTYESGIITLKYQSPGGECKDKSNRTTTIKFFCSHNISSQVPTLESQQGECDYVFLWPTSSACPPFHSIPCTVKDNKGDVYDLSPLSRTQENYSPQWTSDSKNKRNATFIINVCRTLVHNAETAMCSYSSAACLIDNDEKNVLKRVQNVGLLRNGPYFLNEELWLRYPLGYPCTEQNTAIQHKESMISFYCDKDAVYSEPVFIGYDSCTYYFDWTTVYACPHKEIVPKEDCTAVDPVSGFVYNISSLRKDEPYVVTNGNHMYHLSICQPLKNQNDTTCPAETGVCQYEIGQHGEKRAFNAGTANGRLELHGPVLSLTYTGGQKCHGGRFNRMTVIEFYCANGIGKPIFDRESEECTYFFTWPTSLVCQKTALEPIDCAIRNGTDYFDLSLLSSPRYRIAQSAPENHDDALYYINICGVFNTIPNTNCPPSSICRVKGNVSESLGKIDRSPIFDFHGLVTTLYTNGSRCSNRPDETNRARIIFICDPNESEPKFLEYDPDYCTYVFEWRTSVVCPSRPEPKTTPSCFYKDLGTNTYFDLSKLRYTETYNEVQADGGLYFINVCDDVNSTNLTECKGSSVCFQKNKTVHNFGLMTSQEFAYNGHILKMTLRGGDDCPTGENGKRSAVILFTCDPDVGFGKPELHKKMTCLVTFKWKTNLVCRNFHHSCAFNVGDGFVYDFHMLSRLSSNWNITVGKNNFFINLCRGIQQNEVTAGCPPSSAVCMKKADGNVMPLGMIHTVTSKQSDNGSLVLTYKSFSNDPCHNKKYNATTRIFFSCGKKLGAPKLMENEHKLCFYDFSWETSLACPEKGEEMELSENGTIFEKDLQYELDLNPILKKTFTTKDNRYTYYINLSGVNKGIRTSSLCLQAAICQTESEFRRDIGSISTMKFYKRGTELHLILTSLERPCGKNPNRNVTTLINLGCSSNNAEGEPRFIYESTGCDYIFEWDTNAVCHDFHRPDKDSTYDHRTEDDGKLTYSSSQKAAIVISLLFVSVASAYVIFVVSNRERRAVAVSKFRGCFSRVTVPRFRYKRWPMERVSLMDQPKTFHDDDENILI